MNAKASPLSLLADPSLLKTNALINGEWVGGASRFDVIDPATSQKLVDVANLGIVETRAALAAAGLLPTLRSAASADHQCTRAALLRPCSLSTISRA